MLLIIDNYDSFVHNLARYLHRLGQSTRVVRNDQISVEQVAAGSFDAVVFSPGPCRPRDAGCCLELARAMWGQLPMLGVCLGHQILGEAAGGDVIRAAEPMHGRTSQVHHAGRGLFHGLPDPMTVARYHSLVVASDTVPGEFDVTGTTNDGTVMALEHRTFPIVGWQFHPESILTECGYDLLQAFLVRAGLNAEAAVPSLNDERLNLLPAPSTWPRQPVTF